MNGRPHLRGLPPEQLVEALPELALSARAARLVVKRTVREDSDRLDGIEGFGQGRADRLGALGRLDRLRVVERRASSVDPFVKYLFEADDRSVFEAVRIPLAAPRWSVCVSSQAGCALACAFCETGRLGLKRNLEAWEIVEQVLTVRREAPERPVTGVVFQGQGEPLQNLDEVLKAAELFRHPCGLQVAGERITISTSGLLAPIERFTDEGHPYRLILSLTSALQDKREELVPVARANPLTDLAEAMRRRVTERGGVVHLAWVLMAGVNTGDDEAEAIARLFHDLPVRLHVIDVEDPSGRFAAPDEAERHRFLDALHRHGIPFVRRYSGGADVQASCGTLAATRAGGRVLPEPG
ncbi:MAG: radical SAM protein [Acidobacteriota bacterium]